jgi:hypothetical protein
VKRDDASPTLQPPPRPRPVTWQMILRMLGIATLISLFFALAGFGAGSGDLLQRVVMTFLYGWLGVLVGLMSVRASYRLGVWGRGYMVSGAVSGLLMIPPMSLVVFVVIGLVRGYWLRVGDLPQMVWQVGVTCIGLSYLSLALAWRRPEAIDPSQPPKFLERMPLKLRGAELWAVEAEDHYLRLHTSKGQDLILMRLADAVDELEGIEGAQVHRSWWVARDAIAEARRGDGRATLTLKDGSEAPVSRTYAKVLRDRRWI